MDWSDEGIVLSARRHGESAAIAVLLGTMASKYLAALPLKLFAGIGFVIIGGLAIADYFRAGA